MRCKFCGTATNLVTLPYKDEDGFVSEELCNLCHECVELSEKNRKFREEWKHYHEEPCPEGELPHPTEEA